MRTYGNPTRLYSVAVPSNWEVDEQGNNGVTFAPQGGIANVNGQADIVYGAIINHYDPFGNAQSSSFRDGSNGSGSYGNVSLQDATDDLLATVQRSNPYLHVVNGSKKRLRLNGGPALSAALRGVDPDTRLDERVTAGTRALPDEHTLCLAFKS